MANWWEQDKPAAAPSGGNWWDADKSVGGVDTAADSAARGLPPLNPAPRRTGFAGQVADTMAGRMSGPGPVAKTPEQIGTQYKNYAIGGAEGAVQGTPGIGGDIESLLRAGLSRVSNVAPDNQYLPTGERFGNMAFGEPQNPEQAAGRIGGSFLSPSITLKLLQAARIPKIVGAVTSHALGATSGAGARAVSEAYQAGKQGGSAAQTFLDSMRGNTPVGDVVQTAKDAVEELRQQKNAAYRAGIGSTITGDPTVLDFAPIDKAIRNVSGVGVYKGQVLSQGAEKVWQRIENVVDDWRNLPPDQYHTPEGLDALKQKIGNLAYEEDLASLTKPGSPGAKIVGNVYNAIRGQIVQQAPGYGQVMRDYMNASDELRNIESTLSLGQKATTDTSLRKLQSILRNNANTNYGARVELGNRLAAQPGGDELMPALAGQMLSSVTPRGIQGGVAGLGGLTSYGMGGLPAAVPYLAASSPRVVGEAAYLAGRGAGGVQRALANPLKNSVIPGGGAAVPSIGGINPKLLAMMSPQMILQLLSQTNAQTQ